MRHFAPVIVGIGLVVFLISTAQAEQLKVTAKNTRIGWVGTKPDGKHEGGFKGVSGAIRYAAGDPAATQISITIDANSIWSDNEKLTAHLKAPDFFDVRRYKQATFASTTVKPSNEKGKYVVTGDLTLHGKKQQISFPAKISTEGGAFKLSTYFTIDRTEFGMTYGAGKIDDEVTITTTVDSTK